MTAVKVLRNNDHEPSVFTAAMAHCLRHSPKKRANLALVGESDSGKSWLVNPVDEIFVVHDKPAEGSSYPLAGIEDCTLCKWSEFDYRKVERHIGVGDLLLWWAGPHARVRLHRAGIRPQS